MSQVVNPIATSPSDSELLKRYARLRDDEAFARIVARHMRGVRMIAWRYTHHRQSAEDVAQATFLVLAQRARSAARSARLKRSALPWLAKVCRYAAANWRRAESRRLKYESRVAVSASSSHDPSVGYELAEAVRSALACLPRRDRRIVEWRHLSQMPWDEVARHAGTTPEAARKAGTRAMASLRTILERRGVVAGVGIVGVALAALARPLAAVGPPRALEIAQRVILMTRIKTASLWSAGVASVALVGGIVTTQTIGGSGTAPVIVASASPGQSTVPATQPAGASQTLRIALSDDTALEVIGVSDGERFWTADGVPMDKPAFEIPEDPPNEGHVPEGMRRLYVKVDLTGEMSTGEVPAELVGKIGGPGDGRIQWITKAGGGFVDPPMGSDVASITFFVYVPMGHVAASLKFLVAVDPWSKHDLVRGSDGLNGVRIFMTDWVPADGRLTVTPPAGAVLDDDFPPPDGEDRATPRTQLTVMINQRTTDIQPVLRDEQGKWHAMRGGTYPISEDFFVRTFVATSPPESVLTVALLTRPLYHVDIAVAATPEPPGNHGLLRRVVAPPRRSQGSTGQRPNRGD